MIKNLRIEYVEEELSISELYNAYNYKESSFTSNGHELINVEGLEVFGYTSNLYQDGNMDYLPVNRLIRHKVSKGKWELVSEGCDGNRLSIITTEDHGLIAFKDGNLIRLSPQDFIEAGCDSVIINDSGIPRISKVESISKIGDFADEYVYDIEMLNEPHTFFANDILIHNSIYITLRELFDRIGIKLLESEERIDGQPLLITKEAMDIITAIGGEDNPKNGVITQHITKWALAEMNCLDPRFVFAREKIAKRGIFMYAKKRYALQVVDNGGIPVPVGSKKEFSYTGIDGIVTATHAKEIQNLLKEVVKSMIIYGDPELSNKAVVNMYKKFCELPTETLANRKSVKDLKKYEKNSQGFQIGKGTPQNSKASILHNTLLDHLTLTSKYEKIKSGDKIKMIYVAKNKFGLDYVGFKDVLPPEFEMTPNYNLLYNKYAHPVVERIFTAVSWVIIDPTKDYECDILSEFS